MDRIFIFPEDVSALTGKSLRSSQNLLRNLKEILKKQNHQYVTKYELAKYLGISVRLIVLK